MLKPLAIARRYRLVPRRRFVVKFLLLLAVVSVVGHQFCAWQAGRRLAADVAALRASGEPLLIGDFRPPPIPDAENAAVDLRLAGRGLPRTNVDWDHLDIACLAPPITPAESVRMRRARDRHAAVLRHVEAAAAKGRVDWRMPLETPVVGMLLPDLNPQREVACVLALDALLAHHEGDHARAVRRIRDLHFVSDAVDRQPVLTAHRVATGIQISANLWLSELAPTLRLGQGGVDVAEVRAVVDELLDDAAPREAMRRALRADRAWHYDAAVGFAEGRVGFGSMLAPRPHKRTSVEERLLRVMYKGHALDQARGMLRDVSRASETMLLTADWPSAPRARLNPSEEPGGAPLSYAFSVMLRPRYDHLARTHYAHLTTRRLAATALALRWYATENDGGRPDSLGELVPGYLPAVPRDAMAAGAPPLRYSRDRGILYSVGYDGRDDGGSELPRHPTFEQPEDWSCLDVVIRLAPRERLRPDVDVRTDPTLPGDAYLPASPASPAS